MPDLRPLREAEQQLAHVEADTIRQASAVYTTLRERLSVLVSDGRATPLAVYQVFAQTEQQLRTLATTVAQTVDQQAATFAAGELQRLTQLLEQPSATSTPPGDRQTLQAALVDEALLWLNGIRGAFGGTLLQLQLTDAPPEVVQARLLDPNLVDGRVSIWRSGLTALDLAVINLVWGGWNGGRQLIYQQAERRGPSTYQRQAIAAIDRRTTQCCLNVHGQIVAIDQPFTLTGTPRYGNELMWPPFHWRCRTSIVLYHEAMERIGTSTAKMRDQARRESATRGGS